MKKSFFLKLLVLAMLSYVALMPSAANASCDKGECLTADDGWPLCATYGEVGYTTCFMFSWENPTGSGNWSNACLISRC